MINPIIFVPGFLGSILQDAYETPPKEVWRGTSAKYGEYGRVQLHPLDMRYEYKEPARVMASQIYDGFLENWIGDIYLEMIDDLRANLKAPVYPFFYDWRKDLDGLRGQFGDFVKEVIARTALMPEYRKSGYTKEHGKVILIGHSMGGLLIARYMGEKNSEDRVDKIVTIATPFRGSPDTIKELCINKNSAKREAARLSPSVYYLLPRYEGAVSHEGAASEDIFDVKNWQRSIVASFIFGDGVKMGEARLNEILIKAKSYLEEIDKLNQIINQKDWLNKNWLCIVGSGKKTMQKIMISKKPGTRSVYFDLGKEGNAKMYSPNGDGRVPLNGAIPYFLNKLRKNIVVYESEDFEWVDDWPAAKFAGLHALLPVMNVLVRLVKEYLEERWQPGEHLEEGKYGNLWTNQLPENYLNDRRR